MFHRKYLTAQGERHRAHAETVEGHEYVSEEGDGGRVTRIMSWYQVAQSRGQHTEGHQRTRDQEEPASAAFTSAASSSTASKQGMLNLFDEPV